MDTVSQSCSACGLSASPTGSSDYGKITYKCPNVHITYISPGTQPPSNNIRHSSYLLLTPILQTTPRLNRIYYIYAIYMLYICYLYTI